MDFKDWLCHGTAVLSEGENKSESAKRDAEILLGEVTGKSRSFIFAFSETQLSTQQIDQLEQLLVRRQAGEPIAYIVGKREFWSLPLSVSSATLIPRPDTECLVEAALARIPKQAVSILDLGTGTGAIALALASERPDCQVIGVDIQPQAVALAQKNAADLVIHNVTFKESCWFTSLSIQQFAIIVSNPPYIDENDPHLKQGDVRFEPLSALVAPVQGDAYLLEIIDNSRKYLANRGWLLLEHGWQQGQRVRDMFHQYGYTAVETLNDYGGNERVTLGRWD